MTEREQSRVDTKTCPACGGTWAAGRRNCLACGASLESVPAQTAGEGLEPGPLEWTWLDAMADEGTATATPQAVEDQQKPGCLARLLSGIS